MKSSMARSPSVVVGSGWFGAPELPGGWVCFETCAHVAFGAHTDVAQHPVAEIGEIGGLLARPMPHNRPAHSQPCPSERGAKRRRQVDWSNDLLVHTHTPPRGERGQGAVLG